MAHAGIQSSPAPSTIYNTRPRARPLPAPSSGPPGLGAAATHFSAGPHALPLLGQRSAAGTPRVWLLHRVGEMGGALGNPAPRNHFWCGRQTIRLPLHRCIRWSKSHRVPTPLRSTSPFSDRAGHLCAIARVLCPGAECSAIRKCRAR